MPNQLRIRFSVAALLLCCGTACNTTSSRLKARFAREQRCPESQVAVSPAGGEVYHASGCDRSTEYICPSFASLDDPSKSCRERGMNPHEPPGQLPPKPRHFGGSDMDPPK
ncbi:MAG: hypothetical protein ABW061_16490 [Polyangiaceae bacterium]